LSKIESGKMELTQEDYYPASVVNDVVNMTKARMVGSKLRMDMHIAGDIPHILRGDAVRLRQVLMNLLTNAVKYTDEGYVALEIDSETNDETAVLTIRVRDSGRGIRPEEIPTLFDEFVRLETETSSGTEGTGLGLTIAKQLIALMGGDISVQSVFGQGTTFTVVLPQIIVSREKMADINLDGEARTLAHFVAPTARVLIVDDIRVNLQVAEGLLQPYNMQITLASSGAEAITAVQENDFDLVLMDHMMPGMDGVEAVQEIRKTHETLPIVALTANAIVGAREMFLENGFNDFLSKPIVISRLHSALKQWLPEEKQQAAERTETNDTLDITINGVDVKRGLAVSGGNAHMYLGLLDTFAVECAKKLEILEQLHAEGDIASYCIHVHALKAACANIGAVEAATTAAALEAAAAREDAQYVNANHPAFAVVLGGLIEGAAHTAASHSIAEVPANDDDMYDALTLLLKAAAEFNVAAVDSVCERLEPYAKHPQHGADIQGLSRAAFVSNFSEAAEIAQRILDGRET
jgi:CheY-like chemotaxis protein/HPt (histidine-containing phosphotransfer) domain-containing protein/anti-sigma regulatory factor (Ser/Thr protein kinase)